MAVSFFATLKPELTDNKSFGNREAARTAVFEYVELFYNRIRMHSALGYRSVDAGQPSSNESPL